VVNASLIPKVYVISELKYKITSKTRELFLKKNTNAFFKHSFLLKPVMEAGNNAIKMGYERLKSNTPTFCCILKMHKIFKIKIIAAVNVYRRALKFLMIGI
jgi:hypothetical protein